MLTRLAATMTRYLWHRGLGPSPLLFFQLFLPIWACQPFRSLPVRFPTANWPSTALRSSRPPVLVPLFALSSFDPLYPCTSCSPCHCPAAGFPANSCMQKQKKTWWPVARQPPPNSSHHVRRDGKRDQVDQRPQPPRVERQDCQAVCRAVRSESGPQLQRQLQERSAANTSFPSPDSVSMSPGQFP
jgi:hypothetical protein